MSYELPGNPFSDYEPHTDAGGIIAALGALAYEQRTTSLVNLYAAQVQGNKPIPPELREQINERLGYPLDPEGRGKVWGRE